MNIASINHGAATVTKLRLWDYPCKHKNVRYHIVSIQLDVDGVFLTPFHGSTLSDFRKRQNEFLTSEKNVGINF